MPQNTFTLSSNIIYLSLAILANKTELRAVVAYWKEA